MSEVKRYHVTEAGLVEGSALGRINVVLGADFDQVTARLKEGITKHWQIVCDQRSKIDALQALLTAADEKNDTLSTAYLSAGVREHLLRLRVADLEGLLQMFIENTDDKDVIELAQHALKPAEGGGDEQG
ncbi:MULTISPECIES: hypothetical protein [unclassified Pseudomonas]|uniref:hypothetical protein n=1 Tax=unclassified Pseudomonas TaxID=196821 RepID=UPI0018E708B1|nr:MULTISPECIES: hypothetical protein [unclassified Pseudomonas]MBJ2303485.1 hypothetical protein [Pseudomonas sp. MF2846]MBK3490737.1 hypothetical protein [Pseudomonas sp. MF2857]